jgi:hypothetical protein
LYELVLPQRFYYFVEEKDGEISELVYRVRQKNIVLEEDKQYVNALNLLFIKEGIFDRYSYRISVSTYNGTSLKSLVDLLNGAHMGVEVKRPREKLFQLDVFAGALVNTFPNKFDGRFAMGNKFSSSTSFSGGLNFMYTFPNNFRSLMIGASLGYDQYSASLDKPGDLIDSSSPNNIHTVHYEEKFSVRSSFILIPNIYVVYVLNPTNKIKGYVKAGFCVNLNLGNDLDVHSNYGGYGILIDARDKVPHVNVGLGVIAGKNKAELAYYIPSGMTTDSVPFNMGMIGFSYYFTVL